MTAQNDKPREWWIGKTADGFDKWLTAKNPEEIKCRNVFISSDGNDPCVEYIPVIEKSAFDCVVAERDEALRHLDTAVAELNYHERVRFPAGNEIIEKLRAENTKLRELVAKADKIILDLNGAEHYGWRDDKKNAGVE
jgi:hypothetical protein